MAEGQSTPIGILFEQRMQQQRIREANLRARENQEEPLWRQEIHKIIQARFAKPDRESYDAERPDSSTSATKALQRTDIPELDTIPPYGEEQASVEMPATNHSASDFEMPTYEEQPPASDFEIRTGYNQEIHEINQDRLANPDHENYDAERPDSSASVIRASQRTEIPELDTIPPFGEEQSSVEMPTTNRSTSDFEVPTYEEQPPASDLEIPAGNDQVVPPEAPSGDATTTELLVYIERIEEGLRAADRRIEDLEAQQSDSERAHIQAILDGNEAETSTLKRMIDNLKELLDEAQLNRDRLQRKLREGRAREAELNEQLHRANLERIRLEAEAEALRMGADTSREESIPPSRPQSPPEEEMPRLEVEPDGQLRGANIERSRFPAEYERLRMGADTSHIHTVRRNVPSPRFQPPPEVPMPRAGGRYYRTNAGWSFPKGQLSRAMAICLP